MLCQMTEPFLPVYDFEELENEPDPIPEPAYTRVAYPARSFADIMMDAISGKRPPPEYEVTIHPSYGAVLRGELGIYNGMVIHTLSDMSHRAAQMRANGFTAKQIQLVMELTK